MAFAVETPVFEGPFDLLLHLILREQVDIYEVSLSKIVDAYLDEIERLQVIDLDIATEFLLIAATLVELKARRLLPGRDGSTSTTSWRCGRSAICCSPACSSARRSRMSPVSSAALQTMPTGPLRGLRDPTNVSTN
jgi:hypothetical protein